MIPYLGDFIEDDVVYLMFNTFSSDDPSASCTITNFINTDVHIHKDDNTTQRNNAAGITVSANFDGITGSHMIKIDTNDNTVAGFWVTGSDYFVRIEGTTVDGATINAVVAHFSIENRFMRGTDSAATATALSTHDGKLDTADTAIDAIQTDLDNAADGLGALKTLVDANQTDLDAIITDCDDIKGTNFAKDTHSLKQILDDVTGLNGSAMIGTNGAYTGTPPTVTQIRTEMDTNSTKMAPSQTLNDYKATGFSTHTAANVWAVGTRALTDKAGFALAATGANLILKDSTFALAMADATWDEILTGATHNIATSAGKRLREIAAFAIHSGTAQGGNATSITIDAGAAGDDGVYNRNLIAIVGGTGAGQTRQIADYNGTSNVVTVDREWRVQPNATSEYVITASNVFALVDQGQAVAATATTITLRAYASSIDDTYLCNQVVIIAGTGRGQCRLIGAYDGTHKIATICGDDWVTTPDTTSTYVLLPYGTTCTSCVGDSALAQIKSEADDALSDVNLHKHDQNMKAIAFSEY